MAANDINDPNIIATRNGDPVYRDNPSVPSAQSISRPRKVKFGDEQRGFVIDKSDGEIISAGGAAFYEFEEVDNTRFVKFFLEGVQQATGLTSPGLTVFEVVYLQMQENPGTDQVYLSHIFARDYIPDLTARTYRRGKRELLDNEFIYCSPVEGLFFVNIRFMFNGDRLAFVKGFQRKSTKAQKELEFKSNDSGEELPVDEQERIEKLAEEYEL